ncbi:MAG: histidine phosphatase family protein [Hylemonella sp.]|nr:histidine phosphatase family protein [Hylemonella sp.]
MQRRSLLAWPALLLATRGHAATLGERLASGRHVLLMRHANAPGVGDPAGFRRGDCATQRNLDTAGRDQARSAGVWLRGQGVQSAQVFSSPWCRCLDTARLLGLGSVSVEESLASFFERGELQARQTEALQAFVARLLSAPLDRAPILVTHQVNISAYAGGGVASSEMVLVRVDREGRALDSVRYAPPPLS